METFSALLAICAGNSPVPGERGALMFSLICVWINGWVNNGEAGNLRRYRAHYDVILMSNENMVWYLITCNDISMIADIHDYTTRRSGNMNLYVPKCNKELNKRRFAYQGSTLWTEPRHIISMGPPTGGPQCMMTSSNRNIFRVTGHLCGEFTGYRWIPLTKASDAELWCFLWSAPE